MALDLFKTYYVLDTMSRNINLFFDFLENYY